MKLRLATLLAAAAIVAACDDDSGPMGAAGPAARPPAANGPPAQTELAALARSGMAEPEHSVPIELNSLELVSNDNPSEFDDWFQ